MFDPKLYREACRELTAPADQIEEVITMTKNTGKKRMRPLRTALVCAAAVAMMVVSVAAANPEEFQIFLQNVASYVQVDRYRADVTMDGGETFSMLSVPQSRLEKRDGKVLLMVNGEEAADITDALAREQRYVFEDSSDDTRFTITVDGTADVWSITSEMGVINADGSYTKFGSVTTTSEDPTDSSSGVFFNWDPSTDAADAADMEVTTGMYVTTTDDCELTK